MPVFPAARSPDTSQNTSPNRSQTLIRKLVLNPTRDYQPRGVKCGNSPENLAINVPGNLSTMSRDNCQRCPET